MEKSYLLLKMKVEISNWSMNLVTSVLLILTVKARLVEQKRHRSSSRITLRFRPAIDPRPRLVLHAYRVPSVLFYRYTVVKAHLYKVVVVTCIVKLYLPGLRVNLLALC
jgi:hypothetical protein